METIDGPVAPGGSGVIYQVTLASGAVVTNPAGFPAEEELREEASVVMTEDGYALSAIRADDGDDEAFARFSVFTRRLVNVPKQEIDEQRAQEDS